MGETEHFTLYGIREGEEMAVQTPDGLVYAEVPLISNYEVEPQIMSVYCVVKCDVNSCI